MKMVKDPTVCAMQSINSQTACSYSQFVMHKHVLFVLIKPRTCGVGGVCDEDSHNFTVFLAICPSYRLGHVEKEECEVRIVKDPTVCAVHDTSSQATCFFKYLLLCHSYRPGYVV